MGPGAVEHGEEAMRRSKIVQAAVAAALLAGGLALGTAEQASATPWCAGETYRNNVVFPAVSDGGSWDCVMGQGAQSEAGPAPPYHLHWGFNQGLQTDGNLGRHNQLAPQPGPPAAHA